MGIIPLFDWGEGNALFFWKISLINKLFREKTYIISLAVLRMPLGSPGMEIHSHDPHSHDYENYKVVSFSKNGKTKIFDKISP